LSVMVYWSPATTSTVEQCLAVVCLARYTQLIGFLNGVIPSGNELLVPILYTVRICIVKLAHADLSCIARLAASFSDFEVIGLAAVVRECGIHAHPDFVLAAGIACVVIPAPRVGDLVDIAGSQAIY